MRYTYTMFIAFDTENSQAFGPFDDQREGVKFFLQTVEGRELLGITEQEGACWGSVDNIASEWYFQDLLQHFDAEYNVRFVEVTNVEAL